MTDTHGSSSTGTTSGRPQPPYPGHFPVPRDRQLTPHPNPGPPAPTTGRNGMGTAALVLGILSAAFALSGGRMTVLGLWGPIAVTGWEAIVLGILAIIFGGIGIGRARRGEATNRSSALAGLLLGVVGLVFALVSAVFWVDNGSGGGSSTGGGSSSGSSSGSG